MANCEVGEEETGAQMTSCKEDVEDYEEDVAIEELHKASQGNDVESDYQPDFEDKNKRQIAKFCLELE